MRVSLPIFLIAGLLGVAFLSQTARAQQPTPAPAPPKITVEAKRKYAAASAVAAQDPEYVRIMKEVERLQRAADRVFFERLRKLEPSLKEYLDYLEKQRVPEGAAGGQ